MIDPATEQMGYWHNYRTGEPEYAGAAMPETEYDADQWRASLADCLLALARLRGEHAAGRLTAHDLALRARLLREAVGGLRRGIWAARLRASREDAA